MLFPTDSHSSERWFRKFLDAAKFYKANILILGGDISGRLVILVVDRGESFRANYLGRQEIARTDEEFWNDASRTVVTISSRSEMDVLEASKERVDVVFMKVTKLTSGKRNVFLPETINIVTRAWQNFNSDSM